MRAFKRLLSDESGATSIEYSIIAGMMAVVVIGIAAAGGALDGIYERLRALIVATD